MKKRELPRVGSPKRRTGKTARSGDPAVPASVPAHSFWEPLALAATASDTIEALNAAMATLADLYRVDRAWIGRYNTALTHFWGVSECVRPGIISHLNEMQGASIEVLGGAHQKFLAGEIVAIPDVERLPRQARSLQAELRREGIRSTFAAPLVHEGALIGFYGVDYVQTLAAWTPADFERLPALSRFLAALMHRHLTSAPPADQPAAPLRSIQVTEPNRRHSLSLDEVIFIQADGDYSRVHAGDGRHYFERRSLRSWTTQLPRERFLRVHQRYLIDGTRISRVDRGSRWTLQLHGIPDPIPVGRAFRHALRLHLGF